MQTHSMNATERLFSYGTLQLPRVQLETFHRLLVGTPDALPSFILDQLSINDALVVAASGVSQHPIARFTDDPMDRIDGMVFCVTAEELVLSDQYEVSAYSRIGVTLASGLEAWVYARADQETKE